LIRVQTEDFDAGVEITAMRTRSGDAGGGIGGICSFIGVVREGAGEDRIDAMTLEHYPGMTEKELARIEAQANSRWPLADSLIIHRTGRLQPGDQIVLVATASAHRKAAFAACEFLIDWLKTQAPFWKSEETESGAHWVEAKATDDDAASKWE